MRKSNQIADGKIIYGHNLIRKKMGESQFCFGKRTFSKWISFWVDTYLISAIFPLHISLSQRSHSQHLCYLAGFVQRKHAVGSMVSSWNWLNGQFLKTFAVGAFVEHHPVIGGVRKWGASGDLTSLPPEFFFIMNVHKTKILPLDIRPDVQFIQNSAAKTNLEKRREFQKQLGNTSFNTQKFPAFVHFAENVSHFAWWAILRFFITIHYVGVSSFPDSLYDPSMQQWLASIFGLINFPMACKTFSRFWSTLVRC